MQCRFLKVPLPLPLPPGEGNFLLKETALTRDAQNFAFPGKKYLDIGCGFVYIRFVLVSRAEVAQSVEQGTENPRVGSSILSLGISKLSFQEIKGLAFRSQPFFLWRLQGSAKLKVWHCFF